MGGGDLNMMKSWHPLTLANQRRVAEEKQKAQEEAQRTLRIQKELREERQKEEIDQLNAQNTHKTINKLDWMYNTPGTSTEDQEAYLLGNRDAKEIVKQKEKEKKTEDSGRWKDGLFAFSNRNANSERDEMAKNMEDPLMNIKRMEMAAKQKAVASSSSKLRKDKKRHRHRHKHRDRSKDRDKSHRRRHRSRSP